MIEISVQGYLTFRTQVGKRRISMPAGSCLRDVLTILQGDLGGSFGAEAYADAGELRAYIIVLLNGMHCRHLPDGLSTMLNDGDRIDLFPPIAGG